MGVCRVKVTVPSRRAPAWLISMVFHGGLLGLFALLMPALLFHQESFGPPVRVEQRVEPEQRVLPHWQSRAEMPPVPAMEVVLEPVEEFEAAEEQNLAECDVSFTVLGDLNPANSYPVCAVGQFTRARVAQPVAAAMPMVAMPAPSGPVAMPPAPGGAATVRSGGPSHAARVVGELDPRYPERQRVAGRSATVLLLVRIDESGRPADVQLLNDGVHPDFAKAAVSAARKARYEPALAEGRPVASEIRVRVQFQLQ